MKPTHQKTVLTRIAGYALAAVSLLAVAAFAQPTPNPPGQISYQGFLVDGNGIPLATNTPRNYDVIFRIYNVPIGNNPALWGELQTVTVDRGYFSVMLGQGSAVPGSPFTNNLSSIFTGADASDRYIGITVRGLTGGDVEIQPRMRLLASPYSFLAANANALVGPNGQPVIVTAVNTLVISNAVQLNNTFNVSGNINGGANLNLSGNLSAVNISASGNITSPRWNYSNVIPYGGCGLPRSGTFNSNGGLLIIQATGSGYATLAGAYTGINVLIDGGFYGGIYMTFNQANLHLDLPPETITARLAPGLHTLQITSGSNFGNDCGDNEQVTVMELPF